MKPFGIYIHIPFCLSKCPYCDFYSMRYTEEKACDYERSLLKAIELAPGGNEPVDSIYFGGGTPVLMGAKRLNELLDALKKKYQVTEDCEITVEANPAAITLEELICIRRNGFNRISMGVQSAVENQLKILGRLHSVSQAQESVELCRAAGFDNISVDLMLGTPGQTADSVETFCQTFCPRVQHVSAYLLKVEEGTPFARRHIETQCPNDDASADLYLSAVSTLKKWGFDQYEISNFAKDGLVSRHNTRYWNCTPYLGIGPAAHSFWNGERRFFPRDLEGFASAENPWSLWELDQPGGDFFEYAMLRLRLTEGLLFRQCRERYPDIDIEPLKKKAAVLQAHGLVCADEEHIAFTPQGFLVSNSAIWSMLEDYDMDL